MKRILLILLVGTLFFSFNSLAQQKSKTEKKTQKADKKAGKQEKKKEKQQQTVNPNDPLGLNKKQANELGESDKKSKDLLEQVSRKYKKYKTIRANFVMQIENPESKMDEKQPGTIHLKDDKYRLEMNNQEIICDNKTIWTYMKESKEVNINTYKPDKKNITPSQIFTVYEKDFLSAPIEEANENGTLMQIVDITPIDKSKTFFKIKISISKKDNSIKRFKIFDKNGNRYTYEIQKFEPNIKLDDTLFTFDPKKYPGIEVIDLR